MGGPLRGGAWSLVTVAGNNAPPRRGGRAGGQAREAGGRAARAGGGAAAAATAAAIETVAVETVTYQRGPTRSSRCCRRGSCCPNSRPELQVTDATAPGPAGPGECGGRRGSGLGWGGGRRAARPPAAHPKRPGRRARGTRLLSPVPQARPSLGAPGNPPLLLAKLGGKWEPIASLFKKLPESRAPETPLSTLTLEGHELGAPEAPQTFTFKFPELGLLGTSCYFYSPGP